MSESADSKDASTNYHKKMVKAQIENEKLLPDYLKGIKDDIPKFEQRPEHKHNRNECAIFIVNNAHYLSYKASLNLLNKIHNTIKKHYSGKTHIKTNGIGLELKKPVKICEHADGCRLNLDITPDHILFKIYGYIFTYKNNLPNNIHI